MKEFWNERYSEPGFMYGTEPNRFLSSQLDRLSPETILFPADGEGRNSVYAARLGWEVTAFDYSEVAREKALRLAQEQGVAVEYSVGDMLQNPFPDRQFKALAAIFTHFHDDQKPALLALYDGWIAPGGFLIMEVFSKRQIHYQELYPQSGGPRDVKMLFSVHQLEEAFAHYDFEVIRETETELREGLHHVGKSSVIQIVARKPLSF